MSGGSFNYLYSKDSFDIYDQRLLDDLISLKRCLLSDYDSCYRRSVAHELDKVIQLIKTAQELMQSADIFLTEDIRKAMKAVEWDKSSDFSKDDVEKILEGLR